MEKENWNPLFIIHARCIKWKVAYKLERIMKLTIINNLCHTPLFCASPTMVQKVIDLKIVLMYFRCHNFSPRVHNQG